MNYLLPLVVGAAIAITMVIAIGSHDVGIVTENYRNNVKSSLDRDGCDDITSNWHYGEYLNTKDLFMKRMTDTVIQQQVELKMLKCGMDIND